MEKYFVGTELKLSLLIQCEGFDMETDTWTCTVKKGSKTFICDRNTNSVHSEEGWFLLIDTTQLGSGRYDLVVDIDVPDTDYEDGLRHETYKQELFTVNGI